MNEWLEKYKQPMWDRYMTFKIALDFLFPMKGHNIVETGCIREPDDWGAGNSTLLFGEFCKNSGGKLISVDNNPIHIGRARKLASAYSDYITYVESDSIAFFRDYMGLIDLLYLDSMDIPLEEGADKLPCQVHNLHEFQAAEPNLHEGSIVLIDDYFQGDGKGKLTERYMTQRGWRKIQGNQQMLFVK